MKSVSLLSAATFLIGQHLTQANTIRGASASHRTPTERNATGASCPPAETTCPSDEKLDPVVCTRASEAATEPLHGCFYHHRCEARAAGYEDSDCHDTSATTSRPTSRGRGLDGEYDEYAQAIIDKVNQANNVLLNLDLSNELEIKTTMLKYNVSDDDAPHVLELAKSMQQEQKEGVVTTMDTGASSEAVFVNQQLVMIPMPTMGGAWQINDIVAGVGGGLGMEVGAKWGRLTMRADYYRTSQVVQYQMNSFSFIVGYTNINLFSGGTWVGTYHAGGVGIGSAFAAGAAFFCQQGQDPLDCIVTD